MKERQCANESETLFASFDVLYASIAALKVWPSITGMGKSNLRLNAIQSSMAILKLSWYSC